MDEDFNRFEQTLRRFQAEQRRLPWRALRTMGLTLVVLNIPLYMWLHGWGNLALGIVGLVLTGVAVLGEKRFAPGTKP